MFIGDLSVYEGMAPLNVADLVNKGQLPKFNKRTDSLANAQVWHQPKGKTDEWSVTSIQLVHFQITRTIQDPNMPQAMWDKFKFSRTRGLSSNEAIIWQVLESSGPLKVRTLLMLDETIFAKLRETHVVKAPNLIHCIEWRSQESESQEDLSASQDEVFDNAQAESNTAQDPDEPTLTQNRNNAQKMAFHAVASTSILDRRGKVATPQEKEQRLKESIEDKDRRIANLTKKLMTLIISYRRPV